MNQKKRGTHRFVRVFIFFLNAILHASILYCTLEEHQKREEERLREEERVEHEKRAKEISAIKVQISILEKELIILRDIKRQLETQLKQIDDEENAKFVSEF